MKERTIAGFVLVVMGLSVIGCVRPTKGTGVYGKVIDKDRKKPVEGVVITIVTRKESTGATPRVWATTVGTDSEGKFVASQLEPGDYSVTFSKAGYVEYSVGSINVKEGQMYRVNICLSKSQSS